MMDHTTEEVEILLELAGYSKKAIALLLYGSNEGPMPNADVTARHESDCGDMLLLYFALADRTITDARYEYVGCRGLQAAASAITEMVKGRTVTEASKIGFKDVLAYLEGIPPYKYECIHLALDTMNKGIATMEGV